MKKKFMALGIIALAGIAVFLINRHYHNKADGTLKLSGTIEVTEVNVGFKTGGRIAELFAEEGRNITKGERLAVFDSAELKHIVSQNRAYVYETRARLEELRAGPRSQELEQAKANVNLADAELEKARKDFERSEILFKNGAISAQQMDAAKKTYAVTVYARQNAAEKLSILKEGTRKEELREAENRVQQAEALLNASEERLRDATIFAPVSGVILRKNAEAGETVASGIPVCTIGVIEKPWVKVYIKENSLGLIRLGQRADVRVDTYPGKSYEGTITYISSEAEFTPKNIQTQEERVKLVFGVKISVNNINSELKPGMPADVILLIK